VDPWGRVEMEIKMEIVQHFGGWDYFLYEAAEG